MEEWRPVPVEEFSSYEVSSMGAVRHNGRMLKQSLSRGYYAVVLCNKGIRKHFRVHRLVALCFLTCRTGTWINHKDGNKRNNSVNNLEWCTPSENQKHSWTNGLTEFTQNMKAAVTKTILKEVEKQKKKVMCIQNGRIINIFPSLTDAARCIGGSQPRISDCCNGKRYTHKGYVWKFA